MRDTPDPPAPAFTHATLQAVGAAFLVQRPLVMGPLVVVTVGLLHSSGAPGKQTLTLLLGASLVLGFFLIEALHFRTRPLSERYLLGSLLFTNVGITVACGMTGGARSPLLSLLFAPSVTAFAAFGRSWRSALALGTFVASMGVLLCWPSRTFPPIESPWVEAMTVCAAGACALLLKQGVSGLTRAYADTQRQLAAARQELHEAQQSDTARQLATARQELHEAAEFRARSQGADTARQLAAAREELREAQQSDTARQLAAARQELHEAQQSDTARQLATARQELHEAQQSDTARQLATARQELHEAQQSDTARQLAAAREELREAQQSDTARQLAAARQELHEAQQSDTARQLATARQELHEAQQSDTTRQLATARQELHEAQQSDTARQLATARQELHEAQQSDTERPLAAARQELREAAELRAHSQGADTERQLATARQELHEAQQSDTERPLAAARQELREAAELRAHSQGADTERQLAAARQELRDAAELRAHSQGAVGGKAAHAILNRVVTVRSMVELEAQRSRSSSARLRLGAVMREFAHIDDILRDSLGVSHPSVELRREEVDVQRLLLRTSAVLEARARARDVVVSAEGPPLLANVDPRRLEEALFNLMANAVESCAHGAQVEAQATREADGVRILIRDGGHDMHPRIRARLGTPYFTMQEQAMGLGVTLPRSVAREHGGTLTFENEPGRGMRAKLWLPGA